jgi:hypothetical protein
LKNIGKMVLLASKKGEIFSLGGTIPTDEIVAKIRECFVTNPDLTVVCVFPGISGIIARLGSFSSYSNSGVVEMFKHFYGSGNVFGQKLSVSHSIEGFLPFVMRCVTVSFEFGLINNNNNDIVVLGSGFTSKIISECRSAGIKPYIVDM